MRPVASILRDLQHTIALEIEDGRSKGAICNMSEEELELGLTGGHKSVSLDSTVSVSVSGSEEAS